MTSTTVDRNLETVLNHLVLNSFSRTQSHLIAVYVSLFCLEILHHTCKMWGWDKEMQVNEREVP